MASRKEEKERRRQERLVRERELAAQARKRRVYGITSGGVLAVAAVAAVVVVVVAGGGSSNKPSSGYDIKAANALPPPAQKITDLDQAAKAAGCVLNNPLIQGRLHLAPNQPTPKYSTDPPTSGNHDPVPTPDGVYTSEPKPRHFVHTLEHGRVEIQYAPSLSRRRVRQLGGLFNESPRIMLLFPNSTMRYDVAVTAWGHLAGCKKFNNRVFDVIRAFRDRYRDQGPEPSSSQPSNF
jgi:Protein of unknown function (DUF3105)